MHCASPHQCKAQCQWNSLAIELTLVLAGGGSVTVTHYARFSLTHICHVSAQVNPAVGRSQKTMYMHGVDASFRAPILSKFFVPLIR